jgi:ubiquinone/menaquinone biosynthesis C-methylase UbiE
MRQYLPVYAHHAMELSAALRLVRHPRLTTPPAAHWADLGCGTGLFATALAQLLPESSTIYAVDKAGTSLAQVPPPHRAITIEKVLADFALDALPLPLLDGILMANSLHFVREQEAFLEKARNWLKADGCFLLVEYDLNTANPWVPYPVPYAALPRLFGPLGYTLMVKLGEHPSRYQRAPIYSALISS